MSEQNRILIADDEQTFLEAQADLLRDEGYECDCATDAATAKALLRKNRYDLLIADIKMPGNEELNFIEQLPGIVEGLPVILVTGYPSLNTATKAVGLSLAGYLVKPVPIEEFLRLVRQSVIRYETYRMFAQARERLHAIYVESSRIESMKKLSPFGPVPADVDIFLHYTMRNIMASITDLKDLTQALAQNKPKQQACQLLNCPRHAALTEVIREAIFTLEKTKSSFKSRELAALRARLESILDPGY
ncbi:response regulator [candidate division KSB1 bacterium]|nr:response regulator [candidate division KSB1 bacterium]